MKIFNGLFFLLAVIFNDLPAGFDSDSDCCFTNECCSGTFSVGGDWLYWKSEEAHLEYAAIVDISGTAEEQIISSKVQRPKFTYDNGYRIFADYVTCDQVWKIRAAYTHVPTSAKNSFDATSTVSMNFANIFKSNFPIFTAISDATFQQLDSKWNSALNYFDFDISRQISVCDSFQFMPHIGLRGLWLDQTFRLNGIAEEVLFFNSKLSEKIGAFGLEGGIKAIWNIWKGFSIVADVGGSVLYARFKNSGILVAEGFIITATAIEYATKVTNGIAMFDAFIGLQYETNVSNFGINVRAGWEEHIIFNSNQFSLSTSGNMTLQGLTLGGAISF